MRDAASGQVRTVPGVSHKLWVQGRVSLEPQEQEKGERGGVAGGAKDCCRDTEGEMGGAFCHLEVTLAYWPSTWHRAAGGF